jgi:hypothetical protein
MLASPVKYYYKSSLRVLKSVIGGFANNRLEENDESTRFNPKCSSDSVAAGCSQGHDCN